MAKRDWSTTAASNNTADSDIDLEGSTASIRTADNSMRAIMQKDAIWRDDNNGSRSTAGSSNTYTYASAGAGATPADGFSAYATGDTLTIQANHTNTGAATLNVDSVGAKAIRKYLNGAEAALEANDILNAAPFTVIYDADANSSAGAWILRDPQTGTLTARLKAATAVSASSTSVGFTGIPSWVKRITMNIYKLSTDGTGDLAVQIGDSGGYEAEGYRGSYGHLAGTESNTGTSAFQITNGFAAVSTVEGRIVLESLENSNIWTFTSHIGYSNSGVLAFSFGSNDGLDGPLDRVRIINLAGPSDTFDTGTVNILYE